MHLHVGTFEGKRALLFLDKEERIVDLPTRFFRSLSNSSRKLAPDTISRYSVKIRDLCGFLEADPVYGQFRIDDALACLKRPALQRFYSSLQDAGRETATVRLAEAAVRCFANWLNSDESGYVHERNIYPEIGGALTPAPSKRQPRYLTEFEVIQLINAQRYEAQRLVVHFMYDTGVRISEVERVLATDLPDWRHYPEGQMYFPLFIRGSKGRGGNIKQRYPDLHRAPDSQLDDAGVVEGP